MCYSCYDFLFITSEEMDKVRRPLCWFYLLFLVSSFLWNVGEGARILSLSPNYHLKMERDYEQDQTLSRWWSAVWGQLKGRLCWYLAVLLLQMTGEVGQEVSGTDRGGSHPVETSGRNPYCCESTDDFFFLNHHPLRVKREQLSFHVRDACRLLLRLSLRVSDTIVWDCQSFSS